MIISIYYYCQRWYANGLAQAQELINAKAIDYFHPDPATFGEVHQTRLAAMWAHSNGVKTAFNQSNGPFAMMNAHYAKWIYNYTG